MTTQGWRRCFTVPVFTASVALHFALWVMWLGYHLPFAIFWRWETIAAIVAVVTTAAEWSMHEPQNPSKQRGYDVIEKE